MVKLWPAPPWGNHLDALLLPLAACIVLTLMSGTPIGVPLLTLITQEAAVLAFVTLGALVVFHVGAYDLSLGSLFALVLVIHGLTLPYMPSGVAAGLALLVGVAIGALNGVLSVALGSSTLVSFVLGVAYLDLAATLANGPQIADRVQAASWLRSLSWAPIAGVPATFILATLLALVLQRGAMRTALGRHLLAVGASTQNAARAGLDIARYRVTSHAFAGLCAACSSLAYLSHFNAPTPRAGDTLTFEALAAIVIGNRGLQRGAPSPIVVLLAVVLIAQIRAVAPLAAAWPVGGAIVACLVVFTALRGNARPSSGLRAPQATAREPLPAAPTDDAERGSSRDTETMSTGTEAKP